MVEKPKKEVIDTGVGVKDWLDDFEDVDPDGMLPTSTKKCKRWFQFRHWIIYWYPRAMWGWNWAYTRKPPSLPDGSDFNLDAVLSCPSLPDFETPKSTGRAV